MAYRSLYRKYRPKDFDDFEGQDSISDALKYQIETGTFTHSYIFNGIRGTGKTSMAKVFAKTLNCDHPKGGNPCLRCESCIAAEKNTLMDVIEIDAASNNGVDDIRSIREGANFLPAHGKFKVYIIDEVQMLSMSAFNALLKIFEEPPERVVFILATTELHKIPDTILSRAQKYTFRRIAPKAIVRRLEYILKEEKTDYTKTALYMIAEHSGGSLRDAITHLEKTLPEAKGKVSEEAVISSLGLIGTKTSHKLIQSALEQDMSTCMNLLNMQLEEGKDVSGIISEISSFLRALLMDRAVQEEELLEDLIKIDISDYKSYYRAVDSKRLFQMLEIFSGVQGELRYASNARLLLEMAFFEISIREKQEQEPVVVDKKEKVKELEKTVEKVLDDKKITEDDILAFFINRDKKVYELLHDKPMMIVGSEVRVQPGADSFARVSLSDPKMQEAIEKDLTRLFKKKMKFRVQIDQSQSLDEKLKSLYEE